MGRFYSFNCEKCGYNEDNVLEGRGRISKEENIIGTCKTCNRIFATSDGCCKYCKPENHNLKLIEPINFHTKKELDKIECPSCGHNYLTANFKGLWD